MHVDILIAHPHKHHALHFVAGCALTGKSVCLVTPFYRKGLGTLIARVPGSIGKKARGFFHPGLEKVKIISPLFWQLRRLFSFSNPDKISVPFDTFVANKIGSGTWKCRIFVSLQDYMPASMHAAKEAGAILVSDQMLNQSDETMQRIAGHYQAIGLSCEQAHDESVNTEILSISDLETVPSRYCLSGLSGRIPAFARCESIPYGVNSKLFDVHRLGVDGEIIMLARANTIRKGGHLLLQALSKNGNELVASAGSDRIRVVILGKLEPALKLLQTKLRTVPGITIEDRSFPYVEVPSLMASASLFVMPSLSEGMSLAAVEAMQAGLPVLVTPFVGLDFFKDGEMGVEVSDNIESVAKGLVLAFENRQRWAKWGDNCRAVVRDFNWDRYEQQIARTISSLF